MNIESLEKIRLPSVINPDLYTSCLLTCSPSNSSCLVLFVAEDKILYCRPGAKKYKTHNLQEALHVSECMVTVLEGKVYYIIKNSYFPRHDLAMIDFDGSSLQISRLQCELLPDCPEILCFNNHLIESGGKLLLIFKAYLKLLPQVVPQKKPDTTDVFCFLVFQFDFLNKKWMKIDDIGKSTIFLPKPRKRSMSHGISFRATKPQIKPNSIYFLQAADEYIHVYYLENNSFSLLANGLKMVTLHIQEKSNGNLYCQEQDTKFLPQFSDISKLVFARIFTLDPGALGVIRSVCKDWTSIVRPPTLDIDLRYNKYKYPYLVTLVKGTCKFFHPTYNHTFCLDTPELLRAHIKFSRFGWLLLSRYISEPRGYEYFFFNPFTKERKNLPDWGVDEFVTMSFSSPPTSSDCFVVGVQFFGSSLAIIKYGEEGWIFFENEIYYRTFRLRQRIVSYHPVFYKQKCYCLGADKKLVVIDLNTRKMLVVGKIFSTESVEFSGCFLAEDKEGLLGIFLHTEKRIPHVMKMDLSQKKMLWQPVENLNNYMIYVSPAASWSNSAPTKSTENKIYFPIFCNSDSVFYSLSTKKYHSFSGNYDCRDSPFEAQMMTNCAWIDVE